MVEEDINQEFRLGKKYFQKQKYFQKKKKKKNTK